MVRGHGEGPYEVFMVRGHGEGPFVAHSDWVILG
jgi:hypothetical protein